MNDIHDLIRKEFCRRVNAYAFASYGDVIDEVARAADMIVETFKNGGKILVFGNGGSAGDAQHFAGELVCQFEKQRHALPAIALGLSAPIVTAWANDYDFCTLFAREIEAYGNKGDIAFGITTSDAPPGGRHSCNIRHAFMQAKKLGLTRIGLFSVKTNALSEEVDHSIRVPEQVKDTALIQEVQFTIIHLLCQLIEKEFV